MVIYSNVHVLQLREVSAPSCLPQGDVKGGWIGGKEYIRGKMRGIKTLKHAGAPE